MDDPIQTALHELPRPLVGSTYKTVGDYREAMLAWLGDHYLTVIAALVQQQKPPMVDVQKLKYEAGLYLETQAYEGGTLGSYCEHTVCETIDYLVERGILAPGEEK